MHNQDPIAARQKAVAHAKRIVIKVGTRLLTDPGQISIIIEQINLLRQAGKEVILVSSGAVGLGMTCMKLKKRPNQLAYKQALASLGQSELMKRYADAAVGKGFQVAQLLLTVNDLRNRPSHLNIMNCLETLLRKGILPIINENDSVATKELRVGDNDNLSAMIAAMTRAELTIILTTVNGLWKTENGKLTERIPTVHELTPEITGFATGSDDTAFSIGGMQTKLDAAQKIMEVGDYLWIADGREPNILQRILKGEDCGTLFVPRYKSMASKKRWIRFFTPKHGKIIINEGAVDALVNHNSSLLPTGVMAVQGNFVCGDAVDIAGPDCKRIAVGITQYGTAECAAMCDHFKYADPSSIPLKHRSELISRDELVIINS